MTFKLLIFLPLLPKCWYYKWALPPSVYSTTFSLLKIQTQDSVYARQVLYQMNFISSSRVILKKLSSCVCLCVCVCFTGVEVRRQPFEVSFTLSTVMGVLGIKLSSPGLHNNHLYFLDLLLVLRMIIFNPTYVGHIIALVTVQAPNFPINFMLFHIIFQNELRETHFFIDVL